MMVMNVLVVLFVHIVQVNLRALPAMMLVFLKQRRMLVPNLLPRGKMALIIAAADR